MPASGRKDLCRRVAGNGRSRARTALLGLAVFASIVAADDETCETAVSSAHMEMDAVSNHLVIDTGSAGNFLDVYGELSINDHDNVGQELAALGQANATCVAATNELRKELADSRKQAAELAGTVAELQSTVGDMLKNFTRAAAKPVTSVEVGSITSASTVGLLAPYDPVAFDAVEVVHSHVDVREGFVANGKFSMQSLKRIGGNLEIENPSVESVVLKSLSTVLGKVRIFGRNSIKSVALDAPDAVFGGLEIRNCDLPITASFKGLTTLKGDKADRYSGGLDVSSNKLIQSLVFESLVTIEGAMMIQSNPAMKSLSFPKLVDVGGTFTFKDMPRLASLTFSSINRVGGANFNIANYDGFDLLCKSPSAKTGCEQITAACCRVDKKMCRCP